MLYKELAPRKIGLYGMDILRQTSLWLIASLSLGLAPFFPEPHLWGKLKWVAGGAVGMQPMDWADLMMHGAPWVMLAISLTLRFFKKH